MALAGTADLLTLLFARLSFLLGFRAGIIVSLKCISDIFLLFRCSLIDYLDELLIGRATQFTLLIYFFSFIDYYDCIIVFS